MVPIISPNAQRRKNASQLEVPGKWNGESGLAAGLSDKSRKKSCEVPLMVLFDAAVRGDAQDSTAVWSEDSGYLVKHDVLSQQESTAGSISSSVAYAGSGLIACDEADIPHTCDSKRNQANRSH